MKFFIVFFLICGLQIRSQAEDSIGEQRTAVILINMADKAQLPEPDMFKEYVFEGQYSLNSYYKEVSYNKINFVGEIFGWYDLPDKAKDCILKDNDLFDFLNDKMNFKKFDRFLVFYNQAEKLCDGQGLGVSTHGKEIFNTKQGKVKLSISNVGMNHRLAKPVLPYQKLSGLVSGVMVHEMGHGLGVMAHSNIYHCGDKSLSLKKEDCVQSGIADMFAIMGGEGFYRTALHMNVCHKESLGWIKAPQLMTLSSTDISKNTIMVDLYPVEFEKGSEVLGIRINLQTPIPVVENVSLSTLFIEFKSPQGFNSRLTDLTVDPLNFFKHMNLNALKDRPTRTGIDIDGVQIRGGFMKNEKCYTSYLLDMSPGSIKWDDERYDLYDSIDGFLNMGQLFTEPWNNFSVRLVSKNKNGSFRIEIGPNKNALN